MQNVMTTNQKKRRKGFTLIELIIVLAVMAIIAAIAIPNFASVSANSKNKADVQSVETIKRSVLMLVSEDSISVPSTGTKKITLTDGDDITCTNFSTNDKEEAVKDALKDVKKPQGKVMGTDGKYTDTNAASYEVTIDDKGTVDVKTIAATSND